MTTDWDDPEYEALMRSIRDAEAAERSAQCQALRHQARELRRQSERLIQKCNELKPKCQRLTRHVWDYAQRPGADSRKV